MEILPLTGGLGAEILGADVRSDADFGAIQRAFAKYSVIVLRGQDVGPEDHLAFARRFRAGQREPVLQAGQRAPRDRHGAEREGPERSRWRRLAYRSFL